MKGRTFIGLVFVVAMVGMAIPAGVVQADVFSMGGTRDANGTWTGLASLDTVPVGNPGNTADTRYDRPGYGAVSYTYNIGKYEVTAGQYTEFLNKVAKTDAYGLYNTYMDTTNDSYGCNIKRTGSSGAYAYTVDPNWANRPVNYVSYWDSCRFTNWLHNGQPTGAQGAGTTERGAYTLDGYNGDDGRTIQRNPDANWAVTSEDEWYKAAYYKGGGTNAGYWNYPTSSNSEPSNHLTTPDGGNNANFYLIYYTIGSPYYRTPVGEFELSDSPYGTFDQGGNVFEWNEAIVYQDSTSASRGLRGGSYYYDFIFGYLPSTWRGYHNPTYEVDGLGFRVSEVPEPASMALLAMGGLAILRRGSRLALKRRK
jgi:formylglycine-generating enzyme required for sulfatase activity